MTLTNNEAFKLLQKPIQTKARPGKGGTVQEYVPVENVIERLNEVWGLEWDFAITDKQISNGEAWVSIRLFYPLENGRMGFKDAFAGKRTEEKIEWGNTYKACASLALVKACQLLGIDTREDMASKEQQEQIKNLFQILELEVPDDNKLKGFTYSQAEKIIETLSAKLKE